jgi:hypothetical protein
MIAGILLLIFVSLLMGLCGNVTLSLFDPLPDDESFLRMDHLVIADVQVLEDGNVPDGTKLSPLVDSSLACSCNLTLKYFFFGENYYIHNTK